VAEDIVLIGAIGIDGKGDNHILGLVEGATENAAAAQALLDNLIQRGFDPKRESDGLHDGAQQQGPQAADATEHPAEDQTARPAKAEHHGQHSGTARCAVAVTRPLNEINAVARRSASCLFMLC
jgi:hypothetical protein